MFSVAKQLAEFLSEAVCEDRGSDSSPANLTLASLECPSGFRKSSRPYPALPQEGLLPLRVQGDPGMSSPCFFLRRKANYTDLAWNRAFVGVLLLVVHERGVKWGVAQPTGRSNKLKGLEGGVTHSPL